MNYYKRLSSGRDYLDKLISCEKIDFSTVTPIKIPTKAGVYAIFKKEAGETLYVGRSKIFREDYIEIISWDHLSTRG